MFEEKRSSRLSAGGSPPGLKRAIGGLYRSRVTSRILILIALVSALFGGVGLEVCLTESPWEKHIWIPSLLIILAVWIFVSHLLHTIRIKLFGK
ncbi:hypothetical protein [Desulfoluna sp.]|uniref:hypothetical protein n=1 Tax=Desulfoluna sp. TaxID=2045199 RepID=UPI002614721C|nr:hypothetical protein [Desulfoluna sp.]